MGSSVSTEEVIENATIIINGLRSRISSIESSVSSLEKDFINFKVSQKEANETLKNLDEHVLNLRLLEEGRSSYSKGGRFHTRSAYNT